MKHLVIIIGVALLSQSCATMFSGTNYTANIRAVEPGSEIYVDGKSKGTDKVTVRYSRKKDMHIEVKNQNSTTEFDVLRTVKWGSQVANLLNWVYFIPLGTIVDAASGAIWQPEHKEIPEVVKVDDKIFNITIDNSEE